MDKKVTSLVVIIAAILIIGGAVIANKTQQNAAVQASSGVSTNMMGGGHMNGNSSGYQNGTYSATGTYESPDGTQKIGITLTISDGTVTGTFANNQANGGDSAQYEDRFIANYKDQVVGKKISELSGVVSGDSLTVAGFEDALNQIKNQAKA